MLSQHSETDKPERLAQKACTDGLAVADPRRYHLPKCLMYCRATVDELRSHNRFISDDDYENTHTTSRPHIANVHRRV